MKTNHDMLPTTTVSAQTGKESAKLMSLLALAAGAVTMPQTGYADIIYTDLSSNPVLVGYNGGTDEYQVVLPGATIFKFDRRNGSGQTNPGSLTFLYRSVRGGNFGPVSAAVKLQGLASPNGLISPKEFGAAWSPASPLYYRATVGVAYDIAQGFPTSGYNNKYYAFRFQDSTASGAFRYGWIEASLQVRGYNAGGPLLTIHRYGWDNTGAEPTMGQLPVPEPSSAAILALGAMALGARGVRKWRNNRPAAPAISE